MLLMRLVWSADARLSTRRCPTLMIKLYEDFARICSVINVWCLMKVFYSDAELILPLHDPWADSSIIFFKYFQKSSRPEQNIHKSTSLLLKIFFGQCLWPHRIIQKLTQKTRKIVRFPVTGPCWIVYSVKSDLDPPIFFSIRSGHYIFYLNSRTLHLLYNNWNTAHTAFIIN